MSMELPGRRKRVRLQRKFMDVVKEDIQRSDEGRSSAVATLKDTI